MFSWFLYWIENDLGMSLNIFYIETFEYYKGVNEYEIQVGNV